VSLIDVNNQTSNSEVIHWHGLFLPPEVDGAMEEGTPLILSGGHACYSRQISGGIEYYADYGRLGAFDSLHYQQQQTFVVTDLNVSPKWEINIGVGIGPTAGTDHWIIKAILGRHFDWKKPSLVNSPGKKWLTGFVFKSKRKTTWLYRGVSGSTVSSPSAKFSPGVRTIACANTIDPFFP
jgi:hypothetical protein